MHAYRIIVKPIVTEKSMNDATAGKFTFAVARDANKTTIKAAINQAFHVDVVGITTRIVKGKKKRIGMRRQEISESVWKKATVVLKKGQKIDLFEPGEAKSK